MLSGSFEFELKRYCVAPPEMQMRLRRADAGDLRLEGALAVEHLDAVVAGVGDVDVAGRVAGDAADPVELTLARIRCCPHVFTKSPSFVNLAMRLFVPKPSAT